MPVNGYSVGRDISLNITVATGPLQVAKITRFTSKQEATEIKVKGIDGITDNLLLPDGWSGSLDVERKDGTIDAYFDTLENNYYSGVNNGESSITETIQESTGGISQYRYEGVQLRYDSSGEWSGDATVKQSLSWVAARRKKVV